MAGKSFNVTLPKNVSDLITLSEAIQQKHRTDGDASLIPKPWITELNDLTSTAKTAEERQKDLQRTSKEQMEAINVALGLGVGKSSFGNDTILSVISGIRDFLLGHNRDNPRALGGWGFDVKSPKGDIQVVIPRNAEDLIKLTEKVIEKHKRDGRESLLAPFDMVSLESSLLSVQPLFATMQQGRKNSEQATQNRDRALGKAKGQTTKTRGTVLFIVASIRDILLGRYRGSERTLGEWGFSVSDATPTGLVIPPSARP